jgi:CRP-like cAMP-binding protein
MIHPQSNLLLMSLPPGLLAQLTPHLKLVDMRFGEVVAETGREIRKVYFPHTGVISLVVEMEVGDMIETAMVGRDGVANGASALDGKVALGKAIVQLAGTASVIDAYRFSDIADQNRELHSLVIRHEQVLFAQAQQSVGCNASHTVEARMCRWLLRMRDLADTNELTLTQEFLAQMLGVQRGSVSLVAAALQRAGFIRYSRGTIKILDAEGLHDVACECYDTVKGHYEKLFGD